MSSFAQHAADEKCQYEDLESKELLQAQSMVVPQPLDLTAAEEDLLLENQEAFAANGFAFHVGEEKSGVGAGRKSRIRYAKLS